MRQLDDQLGTVIARRRLAGENLDPGREALRRAVAHRVIERHGLKNVQQLPLIFVDALDLHIEHRARVDLQFECGADIGRQRFLIGALDRHEALLKSRIIRQRAQPFQRLGVIQHPLAHRLPQQLGQAGIGLMQPAAEGDAIGLVHDPPGEEHVEIVKHRLLQQVRMQGGDAIHLMAADKGEMAHPHPARMALADQRD